MHHGKNLVSLDELELGNYPNILGDVLMLPAADTSPSTQQLTL